MFSNLLHVTFWFDTYTDLLPSSLRLLLGLFSAFILLAIACQLIISVKAGKLMPVISRAAHKLRKMFFSMGILGLALLFFTYEGAPYVSSRVFYVGWGLITLAWAIYIVIHLIQKRELDKAAASQEKNVKQYLPGKTV